MGRRREPIALIEAKGRKHLTKAEIEERKAQEPDAPDDDLVAPEYLSEKQTNEFDHLVYELKRIGIIGNVDSEALGRYIVLKDQFVSLTKQLNKRGLINNIDEYDKVSRAQIRCFNAVRAAANDLGLTISSRGKLIMPKLPEEPKENRFLAKFGE